jgi:hypothetical protein
VIERESECAQMLNILAGKFSVQTESFITYVIHF